MAKYFKDKSRLERFAYYITLFGIIIGIGFFIQLYREGLISIQGKLSLENASNIANFVSGCIGVLFTLVGVFLLFENLTLQRKELNESRQMQHLQTFEGTFFNLINSQNQITNQIEYRFVSNKKEFVANGRKFFGIVRDDFNRVYDLLLSGDFAHCGDKEARLMLRMFEDDLEKEEISDEIVKLAYCGSKLKDLEDSNKLVDEEARLKQTYLIIFNFYHHLYGHYFRHLYHILKYIKTTEDREREQNPKDSINIYLKYKAYSDFVQAQMSSVELLLLFYDGLCFKGMKKLIHYYNFLENLAIEDLLKPEHQHLYSDCIIDDLSFKAITFKSRKNLSINNKYE